MSKLKEGYIRYSNEEQRKAAIMQAESLGFKKWDQNDLRRDYTDAAIYLYAQKKDWRDHSLAFVRSQNCDEIPLDSKEYDKAMTNTEKQALLFKLEQDKERIEKKLEWLEREEIKAKIAIYTVLRLKNISSSSSSRQLARDESESLLRPNITKEQNILDSIEKHIEELEAGS